LFKITDLRRHLARKRGELAVGIDRQLLLLLRKQCAKRLLTGCLIFGPTEWQMS
jgi:hypothetical protein